MGVNTALRISDLLELQISHFLDEQKQIKRRFWIKDRKRGKRHEVVINTSMREALDEYLGVFPDIGENRNNYVFFSSPLTITQFPSNAARPGSSLRQFAVKQAWRATLAPKVLERPGATMLVRVA
jgi:integrase